MHIGLIVMEYPPDALGGIGSFAVELTRGLEQAGHTCTVIVPSFLDPATALGPSSAQTTFSRGITVSRFGVRPPPWMRWRPSLLWHRFQLRAFVLAAHRRRAFDLLECQDMYGPLPFGGISGVPTIIRHHSSLVFYDQECGTSSGDPMTYWMEGRTIHAARHHIAVSRYVANGVARTFGLPKDQISTIPYAIDTDTFRPAVGQGRVEGRIAFVNSVQPRKGVRELCLAFERVLAHFPNASLQIVGRLGHKLPDGRAYEDFCRDGLSQHVLARIEFLGPKDRETEIVPFLQSAHVCCFPSKIETFGIAPLEAMAVGKPVVYMNHGPGPEIITDSVNGLLCDTSSPEDIASKLIALLTNDLRAARMGQAARERSLDFSRSSWIDRNLIYYSDILDRLAGAGRN